MKIERKEYIMIGRQKERDKKNNIERSNIDRQKDIKIERSNGRMI